MTSHAIIWMMISEKNMISQMQIFYNFRENPTVVEIEPDIYKFFGSSAKINQILNSIKESLASS